MFSPRFSRAVSAAFYALVAQLFLSLAALIIGSAVVAMVESGGRDARVLVIVPVGLFTIHVGGQALRRARQMVDGVGPLF